MNRFTHLLRFAHSLAGVRQVSLLLLLALVLGVVGGGCESSTTEKKFRIGFAQRTQADNWRKTMLESMKRELAFHPEIEFITKDANGHSETQIRQIQELIDLRVDLLIVSPNAAQPITPIVEKAYQQRIPVIVLDRRTASDQYTAYVGANNVEVGRTAGMYANALLKSNGNVVEIGESPGSSADIDRHRGFVDVLAAHPTLRLVKKLEGDWDKRSFTNELTQLLNAPGGVQLIFAQNDRTALKASRICQQLGLGRTIRIIGVDGLIGPNEGIDLVDRRILNATVLYPTGGKEAIRTAVAILNQQPFKRENRLAITLVDSSNVQIMKLQNEKVIEQQRDIERQQQRINDLSRTYLSQKNTLYITLISLFVVMSLGAWALYLYRTKQTAYQTLEQQNEEIREQRDTIETVSQRARLATEEKLRFYSYISHEFNTPLGLILTPTEDLLAKKSISTHDLRNNLQLVQKNAYRLLRLVDQMLDLRKTDAGKIRLQTAEQDVITFVQDVVQDFRKKAEKQRIDLRLMTGLTVCPLWFDAEKLDKVLFNLLSNAFKYTPRGGYIHLYLDLIGERLQIRVKDNGEGMAPDEKAHAFDLFYSSAKPFSLGKGLGLALSMEFIQLHRGDIRLESEKGQGTEFTILLPLGNAHLDSDEMKGVPTPHVATLPVLLMEADDDASDVTPPTTPSRRLGTILLVEDNHDLRTFLSTRLRDEYEIVAEENGEEGWQQALEIIPDLIISDVMLPGLDGLQLTQRVKADLRTSHIPVVLLTAKGQMEQRIDGARAGADAYITKPFNTIYLLETIRTMLANRRKWQQRYASDFLVQSGSSNQDKKFLNQLTALIEQNLTDAGFGVEKLSRDMGLSRVQLYRKVQALMDVNVVDYITEIRLKKAKHLLRETNKPMSEIAYEMGFSSPAYFTTFFKQHTQKTPSDYRKSPSIA
jgi:signal transduction histidine kinase/DNA-binding response OmpR family regulator